jgi:hypothetical protein
MVLDALESFESGTNGLYKGEFAEERKALRDRLAQPEPKIKHWSDCAVHNEPAYPNGECDCGGYTEPEPKGKIKMNKTVATTAKEAIEIFPEVSYWYNEYLKHNTVSAEENQPEPEPVHASDILQERVDETAKDRHEPIAWLSKTYGDDNEDLGFTVWNKDVGDCFPVYTAPQKREWVGLTDVERMEIRTHSIRNMGENFQETLCKAIEAKLKEKNHG